MQKLIETLQELGIEIPADKQPKVKTALTKYYKNVGEVDQIVETATRKLEADRDAWKQKAETAEEALKSFDGIDPTKIQTELESWKQKAADAEKHAQEQIYQRDFEDALKAELESVKFSSEAAGRDVMSQIKAAGLKLKDGKILGLGDLLGQIKKSDASAFVDEEQEQLEQNKARFTTAKGADGRQIGSMSKKEIMDIKDPSDRQAAIAANLGLFGKGE